MSQWLLTYEGFDADAEGEREALCTLGNGYFATRGAVPEAVADGVHYPGTYVAGVYNRLVSRVSDRAVENESIVNVPNWLPVTFRAEGGAWFDDADTEIVSHQQELDMYRGVLTRRTRFRDHAGRILQVTQRRFVSMRDPHLAGLETTLVAENWSGTLEVRSALDGTVRNSGVARYNSLENDAPRPDLHRPGERRGRLPAGRDQRITRADRRGGAHPPLPRRPACRGGAGAPRAAWLRRADVRRPMSNPARSSSSRRSWPSSRHATPGSASPATKPATG